MNFMHKIALTLALSGLVASAGANPRDDYARDSREAAVRYDQERRACDDEKNHGQRKKCLRAAKQERDQYLAAAQPQSRQAGERQATCRECGRVTSIDVNRQRGDSNALGVVAGGAAGALLGNQVGSGSGKTLATIAGAVGGAYAGKKIQEKSNETKVWVVNIRFDNGSTGSVSFDHDPGLHSGDRVRRAGNSLTRL